MGITWTAFAAIFGLVLGIVNSVAIYLRLGHDLKLRKTELALKLVAADYEQMKLVFQHSPSSAQGGEIYPPGHLLDIYLPLVEELYKTGTFNAENFLKRSMQRSQAYSNVQDKLDKQLRPG